MTMPIWNVIRTKYLDVLFDAYIMKLKINVEINYKSKSRLIKLYYLFMTFCKYFSYKYFISNFYLGLCVHSLLQLYFLRQIGKFKISSVVCCSPCIWRFKETMIEILVSVIIYKKYSARIEQIILMVLSYLSSISQNTINLARSRCLLFRDSWIILTAQFPIFFSKLLSSHFKWKAATTTKKDIWLI